MGFLIVETNMRIEMRKMIGGWNRRGRRWPSQ